MAGTEIVFRRDAGPGGVVYALPGSNERALAVLRAAFPGAEVTSGPTAQGGTPRAWLVSVPPNAPALPPAA
ncbi:MAG: hypothetical protein KatS3mg060_1304 [Dehalococcoidia bacterium]|nr:MAG: hypothetical protein KatS3mg060_1304 [Dehalococcoidia bacterium]